MSSGKLRIPLSPERRTEQLGLVYGTALPTSSFRGKENEFSLRGAAATGEQREGLSLPPALAFLFFKRNIKVPMTYSRQTWGHPNSPILGSEL